MWSDDSICKPKSNGKQKELIVFTWWDCSLHRSIGTASATSTKNCAATAEHVPVSSNNPMVLPAHFCTLDSLLSVTNAWIMHRFNNNVGKARLIRIGFLSSPFPGDQKHQMKLCGDNHSRNSGQKWFALQTSPPGCKVKYPRDIISHSRNWCIQGNMVPWMGALLRKTFTYLFLNENYPL